MSAHATTPRHPWLARGAILLSIALACVGVTGVVIERLEAMSAPVPTVLGLRLGATPDEVRASRGGEGWTTRVDQTGDLLLERDGEHYSFHEGLLVAVDVLVRLGDPGADGPAREVSVGSVLARDASPPSVRIQLVSRTCPTHTATVDRLLER